MQGEKESEVVVVGADGYDSFVRRRLGIAYVDQGRAQLYSVFQFVSRGDVPGDGGLFIDKDRGGRVLAASRRSLPIQLPDRNGRRSPARRSGGPSFCRASRRRGMI